MCVDAVPDSTGCASAEVFSAMALAGGAAVSLGRAMRSMEGSYLRYMDIYFERLRRNAGVFGCLRRASARRILTTFLNASRAESRGGATRWPRRCGTACGRVRLRLHRERSPCSGRVSWGGTTSMRCRGRVGGPARAGARRFGAASTPRMRSRRVAFLTMAVVERHLVETRRRFTSALPMTRDDHCALLVCVRRRQLARRSTAYAEACRRADRHRQRRSRSG